MIKKLPRRDGLVPVTISMKGRITHSFITSFLVICIKCSVNIGLKKLKLLFGFDLNCRWC